MAWKGGHGSLAFCQLSVLFRGTPIYTASPFKGRKPVSSRAGTSRLRSQQCETVCSDGHDSADPSYVGRCGASFRLSGAQLRSPLGKSVQPRARKVRTPRPALKSFQTKSFQSSEEVRGIAAIVDSLRLHRAGAATDGAVGSPLSPRTPSQFCELERSHAAVPRGSTLELRRRANTSKLRTAPRPRVAVPPCATSRKFALLGRSWRTL